MTGVVGRFVKCRGIMFTQPVHRDKPPQMGHHYLWGSKHHNLAYTTIYGQYTGTAWISNTLVVWLHLVGVTSSECFSCRSVHWLTECPTFLGFSTLAEHHMLLHKKSIGSYRNSTPPNTHSLFGKKNYALIIFGHSIIKLACMVRQDLFALVEKRELSHR